MENTEKYHTYYQDKSGTRVVGWKNREVQFVRFEQLAKIIVPEKEDIFSVNDLGCGMGHFSEYLKEKFVNFEYRGYDILPDMIKEAKLLFGHEANCHFSLIQSATDMQESDYSVASGIFNLRFEETDKNWLYYILETIRKMNEKSRKGFAFNCLTQYSDTDCMEKTLYYADPCFLFNFCKQNFSKNVALLHDYQQYDFTILVRK